MVEFVIHKFDNFGSYHGLAIFAFGSLFASWDELTGAIKHYKTKETKNDQKETKRDKKTKKYNIFTIIDRVIINRIFYRPNYE